MSTNKGEITFVNYTLIHNSDSNFLNWELKIAPTLNCWKKAKQIYLLIDLADITPP